MVALVAFPKLSLSEAKISNGCRHTAVVLVALLELDIFQLCVCVESGSFGSFPKNILSDTKISNGCRPKAVVLVALVKLDIFQLCVCAESGSFGSFPKIITFRS